MKHILLALLLCSMNVLGPANAQTASEDSLFAEGAQLYQNDQFSAARKVYENALESHGPSGTLFYNLGTVHYRLGDVGEAIQHYEKAAELMPDHPELQRNLAIARESIQQPIPAMRNPFWQRWWNHLLTITGPRGLFLIGLTLYLPGAGLFGYRIWSRQLPQWLRRMTWTLAMLATIAMAGGLLGSWQQTTTTRGVILDTDVPLYADPATDSAVERTIPEGTVVHVNEDLPEWQNVKLPNGSTGWVEKSRVGDI